jgi:hypothetical protein
VQGTLGPLYAPQSNRRHGSDKLTRAPGGDRIGGGGGPTVAGSDLWGHSTTVAGAAIGFGTNDAVTATSYDTVAGTFAINSTMPGASFAQVTIGGAVGTFDATDDFLFYPNESAATDSEIVATAQSLDGGSSTSRSSCRTASSRSGRRWALLRCSASRCATRS